MQHQLSSPRGWRHPWVRLAYCVAGALIALWLVLWIVMRSPLASPLFLASLGGSTVFLFGLTRAPAAQPRALLGGHLLTAAIGIACWQAFGDAMWVYALAESLALACMLITRSVHPPAGANPLIMVHLHASWSALWSPVLLGVGLLAALAMLWSRIYPELAHYPVDIKAASPPHMNWGGWAQES